MFSCYNVRHFVIRYSHFTEFIGSGFRNNSIQLSVFIILFESPFLNYCTLKIGFRQRWSRFRSRIKSAYDLNKKTLGLVLDGIGVAIIATFRLCSRRLGFCEFQIVGLSRKLKRKNQMSRYLFGRDPDNLAFSSSQKEA